MMYFTAHYWNDRAKQNEPNHDLNNALINAIKVGATEDDIEKVIKIIHEYQHLLDILSPSMIQHDNRFNSASEILLIKTLKRSGFLEELECAAQHQRLGEEHLNKLNLLSCLIFYKPILKELLKRRFPELYWLECKRFMGHLDLDKPLVSLEVNRGYFSSYLPEFLQLKDNTESPEDIVEKGYGLYHSSAFDV